MTATTEPVVAAAPAAALQKPNAGASVLVRFLGSMKLSVWLVLLLAVLTWLGTLAQSTRSTYDVQREYFESWFVIAELPLSFWGKALFLTDQGQPWALRIPLPGAYPVMALLFVNLIVGGLLRMKWNARNTGILITHFGIAFLLVAGFVKLHYSYAGALSLFETPKDPSQVLDRRVYQSSRFVSFHDFELALLVDKGDTIEERVIPEAQLWGARGDGSVTLRAEGLPFTVQVSHWIDNSQVLPKGPMVRTTMPVVDGAFLQPVTPQPGVQPKSEGEFAGCYVKVFEGGSVAAEGIVYGMPRMPMDKARYPFTFKIKDQRYGLDLRHVVYDLPFAMRLDKFQKLDHPGTMSPRDFRSFVSVLGGAADQSAEVFMNNPLRKDGYVIYQTSWGPSVGGPPFFSVFEVSYNPSDIWPAVACIVIWIGLTVHFLLKLFRFLHSSTRTSLQN